MSKLVVVLLSILLFSSGVISAPAPQQNNTTAINEMRAQLEMFNKLVREIDKKIRSARENGNTLTELEALRTLSVEYSTRGPEVQQMVATLLMQKTVELSNYAEALAYADVGADTSVQGDSLPISKMENYEPTDALGAISKMAENAQIILINEAHHVPQHRAFTLELLKRFRQKGFTHFAAETLYEADTLLNERGYPTKESGAYINEPVYGDLIRTSLKLGYRVIPYEWTHTPNNGTGNPADNRERGQAKNLFDRILKENPEAKVLVHAGYSHINETGTIAGAKTMAQRLKEMTGIDPLTIDQTVMTEHSATAFEHPLYRYVMEEKTISQPSLFRNPEGEWWTLEKGKWDLTLFHPRSVYEAGRPTWLRLHGLRKPYELPTNICGSATRCFVRVRVAAESDDAIPIDQVEVVAGRGIPVLMLPTGEFVLEVKDAANKILKISHIEQQ